MILVDTSVWIEFFNGTDENKLILLHDDEDFDRVASVCQLRVYERTKQGAT